MLGSYYPPYFPTPGQPRIAPGAGGFGAYYQPTGALGAYYQAKSLGTGPGPNLPGIGTFLVGMVINAGAGYLVGKQLGNPTTIAIATGIFGLPGMFVATWAGKRGSR